MCSQMAGGGSLKPDFVCVTIESGYQSDALIGIPVKQYALHNEVCQVVRFEG